MNRVPPSNRPPPPIIRPPRRPRHVEHKHEVKQEEQLEEGEISEVSGAQHHILKAHEENAHEHAEAMGWTSESHAEAHEKKADKEEQLAESQRQDDDGGQGQKKVKQPLKTTTEVKKADQNKPGLHQTVVKKDEFQKPNPQAQQLQSKLKPAIDALGTARMGATEAVSAAGTTDAVREAAERAAKSGRPPDAMQLLNMAQEHGVFFKEDSERGGHSEEHDDPELAAAVEEAIKLMFGVRGVLRIGPGRNQADEAIIVIVAGQGFGEASMRVVPEKVHRFPTLVAVPYDVLPLKKER